MLMTDGEIKKAINSGQLKIEPYDPNRQEPCSYDARLGNEALVSKNDSLIDLTKSKSVTLQAGDFALIITLESFTLARNMAAHIGMKSTLARRGLILLAGIQIDPGFDGHLQLGLYNSSGRSITIDHRDIICTIEFHQLAQDVEKGIEPFPDLKEGRIPESAKAYLRQLESTSLSDVARDIRSLTQNMNILTATTNTLATVTYKIVLPALLTLVCGVVVVFIKVVLLSPK